MSDTIFIPFPKRLYDNLVRLSDGKADVPYLAASFLESDIQIGLGHYDVSHVSEWLWDLFGDRIYELAEEYAPHSLEKWQQAENAEAASYLAARDPLVWKEITVPPNSEVRMSYGGAYHYAKVRDGKIVDDDGAFSPSQWAQKVAEGTSRNAWRDLWLKEAQNSEWVPAQLLREKALVARRALLSNSEHQGEE